MLSRQATRREGRELQKLYAKIPTFECEPGCNDCCGPVPFSVWEWSKVIEKKKSPDGLQCPYSTSTGCSIYENRPLMCRIFGTVDDERLECPRGRAPAQKLSAEEGADIVRAYIRLTKPHG